MTENLVCKRCGNDSFSEGILDGYAKVRPKDVVFTTGSALTVIFCNRCGEVASLKVDKPHKFK